MTQKEQTTTRITKAKALELQKAQEAENQRKLEQQKKMMRLAWDISA